jgi:hypothetical protein
MVALAQRVILAKHWRTLAKKAAMAARSIALASTNRTGSLARHVLGITRPVVSLCS